MTLTTTEMHRYSKRQFTSLEDSPSENTLTVNLTHQQLTTLAPPFKRLVAIAPSRYEEGHISPTHDPKGYDVKLETAKELVFQHKAPDNTVVRNGKQWRNYKIDTRQLKILAKYYSPREAYIALPATPQKREVRQGLERTIFVDIWPLFIIQTARSNDISLAIR